jgi:hypothetical protein
MISQATPPLPRSPEPESVAAAPSATPARLWSNDSGAIMVIGVFMAIVLVGLLYYISGVGQMVFRRERMQDAADAVALATAIGHARGMNLIAFINMVMAALVAIVLALKIIELMLTGLALILVGISWFVPPAAAAVPVVNQVRSVVKEVHDAAREIVDNILIGLNMAERAIRIITPAESVLSSTLKVQEKYADIIDTAVGVPVRLTLPVENDKYNELCNRAGDIIQGLIEQATAGVPFVSKVLGFVAGGLITAVKNAYCYKDGSEVPPAPIKFDRVLPIDADPGQACEHDKSVMDSDSDTCKRWEQELRDRHPESDGNCPKNDPRTTVCENTLSEARKQCNPQTKPRAKNYSWAEQRVHEEVYFDTTPSVWAYVTKKYEYVPSAELKNTGTYSDASQSFSAAEGAVNSGESPNFDQLENAAEQTRTSGKPCDNTRLEYLRETQPELLWSDWNEQVYWRDELRAGVVKPVCDKRAAALKTLPNGGEIPEQTADGRLPPGFDTAPHPLDYDTVMQVYGCMEDATLNVTFPKEWTSETASEGGDDKAPQKMEDGEELGGGDFQIRGIAMIRNGDRRPKQIDIALKHASFEREVENESWVKPARTVGKLAVAQAEYYFNHNGNEKKSPIKEWLWYMDWRARLVRFRLPGGDKKSNSDDTSASEMDMSSFSSPGNSEGLGLDIGSIGLPDGAPSLNSLEELIVH